MRVNPTIEACSIPKVTQLSKRIPKGESPRPSERTLYPKVVIPNVAHPVMKAAPLLKRTLMGELAQPSECPLFQKQPSL